MAEIKQLKEKKTDEIFYPVTVGQGVIFEDDSTNAAISENDMNEMFSWSKNSLDMTTISTDDDDNVIEFTIDMNTINEGLPT